jgi:hypothetical protein
MSALALLQAYMQNICVKRTLKKQHKAFGSALYAPCACHKTMREYSIPILASCAVLALLWQEQQRAFAKKIYTFACAG